jgi:hypothetical protein
MKIEKNSPTILVTSAIEAEKKVHQAIADSEAQFDKDSARLDELLLTGDLSNEAVVAEISRLNIFVTVHPRRLALQQNAAAKKIEEVVAAVEKFKVEAMLPLVRSLKKRMGEKVETELRPHFGQSKERLANAVADSTCMRELDALSPSLGWSSGLDMGGIQNHAANMMRNFSRLEAIEASFS